MKFLTLITVLALSFSAFALETETFDVAVTNTKNGTSTLDKINYRVLFSTSGGRMALPIAPANEGVADTLRTLVTDGVFKCSGKRFKGSIYELGGCEKIRDLP